MVDLVCTNPNCSSTVATVDGSNVTITGNVTITTDFPPPDLNGFWLKHTDCNAWATTNQGRLLKCIEEKRYLEQELQRQQRESELRRQRERSVNARLQREAQIAREAAERPKRDFEAAKSTASNKVKYANRNVVLVVGAAGAGKTTFCRYGLGIDAAVPVEGETHGTKEMALYSSDKTPYGVVDTIGRMPDVKSILRVVACAYNKGWNPAALVVVHSGRSQPFNEAAIFTNATKFNTVKFEPNSFYALVASGKDPAEALATTVTSPAKSLSHLNSMPAVGFKIEDSNYKASLSNLTHSLTWEDVNPHSGIGDVQSSLMYYLVKSIAERAKFGGSDFDFINLVA